MVSVKTHFNFQTFFHIKFFINEEKNKKEKYLFSNANFRFSQISEDSLDFNK